jgi:hypothetical protein
MKEDLMAKEATSITSPSTLVEELVERSSLSWLQLTVVVGLGLILFLVGTAYMDGLLTTRPLDTVLWRNLMQTPALILYLLAIQPTLRRLRDGAIDAFRPLVPISDEDYYQLVAEAPMFNRRWESLALGLGVGGFVLLSRPWDPSAPMWDLGSSWLVLYGGVCGGVLYGLLLSHFIYSALSGTRLFTQFQRHPPEINVFDLKPLEPIGRWSLGIALAFVGGTTLSLLFLPNFAFSLPIIVIYSAVILAPVIVFFLNMLSTHRVMVEAKARQLEMVGRSLAAASHQLMELEEEGETQKLGELLDSMTAWVALERRIKEVPEWPYSQSIMRRLVASILLPLVVFLVQGVLFQLLLRFLPLE